MLQSLLLLRQTVDNRDIKNPLSINGPYLQAGSFPELVFMHDYKARIKFEIEFSTGPHTIPLPPVPARLDALRYETIGLDVEFGYNKKTMQVFLERSTFRLLPGGSVFEIKRRPGGYQARLDVDMGHGEPPVSFSMPTSDLQKFYSARVFGTGRSRRPTTRSLLTTRSMIFTASRLAGEIEEVFSSLFYIGPLREWPKRVYITTGAAPQDVGLKGELSVDVLWVQTRSKKARERLLGKVNRWMEEFKISSAVKLRQLAGNNYSVELTDPHTNLPVNLADVGFGASQVFPIVIEGFYAPPKAMLLIEQPEIHLHPKAQGTLGDLLIDIVRTGNKTLLVETHSEHLVSRVRRRIGEGKLSRNDVAIYYCSPSAKGTEVSEIRLNELGQFEGEGLPAGFFEEGYTESLEHFRAMVESTSQH